MSMSDPLGDLLTRIRNGLRARHTSVDAPSSRMFKMVLDVLKNEGYIRGYAEEEQRKGIKSLRVELKYASGEPAIREIKRVSTPGRRFYCGVKDLPRVYNGLGILILSTPQGVMSDGDARTAHVGGEVLCKVF